MKNFFLATLATFLLASTFVIGQKTQTFDTFTKLDISAGIQTILVQSDEHKAEYTIIKGDESRLILKQRGNTLVVSKKKGTGKFKAKVTIYTKNIDEVEVYAGASLKSESTFNMNQLSIECTSGGSAHLMAEAKATSVEISSGASLKLNGSTKNLSVEVSSGGSFNGKEYEAKNVSAEASSGGSAKVWATHMFDAEASSGGSIRYKGEPSKTNIDKGMSGSIRKL